MAELAAHQQPTTPEQYLSTWKSRRRIPVPTRKGATMDLHIHLLIEASAINGVSVDAVIHANSVKLAPMKTLCVVFSGERPQEEFPMPCLWINGREAAWLLQE